MKGLKKLGVFALVAVLLIVFVGALSSDAQAHHGNGNGFRGFGGNRGGGWNRGGVSLNFGNFGGYGGGFNRVNGFGGGCNTGFGGFGGYGGVPRVVGFDAFGNPIVSY